MRTVIMGENTQLCPCDNKDGPGEEKKHRGHRLLGCVLCAGSRQWGRPLEGTLSGSLQSIEQSQESPRWVKVIHRLMLPSHSSW